MTGTQPTPFPGFDLAAWDQKDRDYARLANEVLRVNKTALFDALTAAGVTSVIVHFDGFGDSGQIECVDANAGAQSAELPPGSIEIARVSWGSLEITQQESTVRDAIESLVYDCLEQTHDGWENEDGAYGDFTFDVAERTISLDYNDRYTSSEYHRHEF